MCVYSVVHDHFRPLIPDVQPIPTIPGFPWVPDPTHVEPAPARPPGTLTLTPLLDVAKLVSELKEALAHAAKLDELMNQKDCVDPEKAKLQERVDRLEAAIAAGSTVKVEKSVTLDAGTYRIIEGKLYRVVE